MKRFLKNIAWDIFLIWSLIYFGLFLQMEYVYNVALAFFWLISIGGLIVGLGTICSKEMLQKAAEKHKRQLWIHKKYQAITTALELAAMFAFGYFWLGGFYLVAALFIWSAKSKIEEEAK